MIGGGGEKKTLRLVARYADACNLFASPGRGPAAVAAKLDVLREHCEREGTDYDAHPQDDPLHRRRSPRALTAGEQFAEEMTGYAGVGVTEVHVMPLGGDPVAYVENLGEHVMPHLAGR